MARLYGPGAADPPPLVATADLTGLSTSDVEGRPVGELVGALSEKDSGLIRYVDVALRTVNRHVLVPIGHVRIDRDAAPPRVQLRAATFEDLCSIPEYDPERTALDGEYQEAVLEQHGRLFYGSRYYAHPAFAHATLSTGPGPIVGPEVEAGPAPLRPLSELPRYRVAEGSTDIRGWSLEDSAGERVGEVRDLLVEPAARKARYAVIGLEDLPRETVLPVGFLDVEPEGARVVARSLTEEDIRLLPAYDPPLDRAKETRIHAALDARLSGSRYFERPDFWSS